MDAERVLQEGIARVPDAVDLYFAVADLYTAQSRNDDAAAALGKLRDRKRPEVAVALGDYFADRHQLDVAIAEYTRGVQDSPGNLKLMARLVEVNLGAGRTEEAGRWNSEILRTNPDDQPARLAGGRILLAEGKVDAALAELRKHVTRPGSQPQAHHYLGQAYVRGGNLTQARIEFQETVRQAPGYLPALLALADVQVKMGDLPSARTTAETAVQMHAGDDAARKTLGIVLVRQRDLPAAREQLAVAHTKNPTDPETLVLLGVVSAGERKWAEAEKYFESALALDPVNGLALSELTTLFMLAGQPARAVARLQQHIAANSGHATAHLLLGWVYRRMQDYKRAEVEFARTVQLAPKQERARLMLGGVLYEQGLMDAAIIQLEDALKQQPRSASLHLVLGQARLRKAQFDLARKHFEEALALDPSSAVAANNVAFIEANHGGNLDSALALAQKAHDLAPNLVSAADTLGWIQYKKGWHQRAIPLFEDCVKKSPESATYRYHLGMALLAAGQKERSRSYLEAALQMKLEPEDVSHAREALATIQ